MKRKKGEDEEFDVFGADDSEEFAEEEAEGDEGDLYDDELDEDEFGDEDGEFEEGFEEGDDFDGDEEEFENLVDDDE
jgi:hypothetical protein